MLEMNMDTSIDNINYLRYMDAMESKGNNTPNMARRATESRLNDNGYDNYNGEEKFIWSGFRGNLGLFQN